MPTVISYLIFEESHKFIVYLPFRLFSIMDATPLSVPPVSEILKTATSITATDSIVDPETSDTALLTSAILPVANSTGLFDLDQATHKEPLELLFLTGRKSGQHVAWLTMDTSIPGTDSSRTATFTGAAERRQSTSVTACSPQLEILLEL